MTAPGSTWLHVSLGMTEAEKEHLDECAEASGKNRNRFIRDLLSAQRVKQRDESVRKA